MEYHEIFRMDRGDLEKLLESGNESAIVEALLSAAYYDPDWRWVQGLCLRFLDHGDRNVRWNAATCLGHIARIHRNLDLELVLPKLIALKADPSIASSVEDGLGDIHFFLRIH
jgi:hypothetical protein